MADVTPVTAPGGWSAPSDTIYDAERLLHDVVYDAVSHESGLLRSRRIEVPEITASRGGMAFRPPTPAEAAAQEAYRARAQRVVEQVTRQRERAIADACEVALANGWDVHLYYHPEYGWSGPSRDLDSWTITGRVGIRFRPARYAIPTVVEHHGVDATYTDDEDWSDEWPT